MRSDIEHVRRYAGQFIEEAFDGWTAAENKVEELEKRVIELEEDVDRKAEEIAYLKNTIAEMENNS